jgi:hypothetical protein
LIAEETTVGVIIERSGIVMSFLNVFYNLRAWDKGKIGKRLQFGRIAGQFLILDKSKSVRMDDKESLQPMIKVHQELFGKNQKASGEIILDLHNIPKSVEKL